MSKPKNIKHRDGFTFFKSYDDVMQNLNDKQFLQLMRTILDVQFLRIKYENVKFNDNILDLLWSSMKYNVSSQIDGYLANFSKNNNQFMGVYNEYIGGLDGGYNEPLPEVQEQEQVQVQGKVIFNASLHFAPLSDLIIELTTKTDTKNHQPIKVIKQFDEYLQQFEYETDEDKLAVNNVLDIGYSFIKYRDYMFHESNKDSKFKLVTKKSVIDFINTICSDFPNINLENLFDKMEAKSWASINKDWKI